MTCPRSPRGWNSRPVAGASGSRAGSLALGFRALEEPPGATLSSLRGQLCSWAVWSSGKNINFGISHSGLSPNSSLLGVTAGERSPCL